MFVQTVQSTHLLIPYVICLITPSATQWSLSSVCDTGDPFVTPTQNINGLVQKTIACTVARHYVEVCDKVVHSPSAFFLRSAFRF